MLSIRKRGKFYYVRGTIRVGGQIREVKEHSSGFTKFAQARDYASSLEHQQVEHILHPDLGKNNTTTFDECLVNYLSKKHPKIKEINRIENINRFFAGCKVQDIKDRWNNFCRSKSGVSQNTLNRYISTMNAILNMAEDDLGIKAPALKKQPVNDKKVFMLTDDARKKLLSCYTEHDRPIFTVMAYQGFREQECLQLLWEDIDLKEHTILIRTSKNGETRQAPMNIKTWWALARHWVKEGKPKQGHVWLNTRRKQYTDTRVKVGSSPIYRAHQRAVKKLEKLYGIKIQMRVHDWRHDWASRMVAKGNNLLIVQKLGGWKSLAMVNRYATFSKDAEMDAINKI